MKKMFAAVFVSVLVISFMAGCGNLPVSTPGVTQWNAQTLGAKFVPEFEDIEGVLWPKYSPSLAEIACQVSADAYKYEIAQIEATGLCVEAVIHDGKVYSPRDAALLPTEKGFAPPCAIITRIRLSLTALLKQ